MRGEYLLFVAVDEGLKDTFDVRADRGGVSSAIGFPARRGRKRAHTQTQRQNK
jgi:hypothetical protein